MHSPGFAFGTPGLVGLGELGLLAGLGEPGLDAPPAGSVGWAKGAKNAGGVAA